MSFITNFWKSGMQPREDMDAKMRERVAITSIYAQKIVDSFVQPEVTILHSLSETRLSDRPMYSVAHPDLKASDAGTRSTFLAAKQYAEESKQRSQELLEKYSS